VRTFPYVFIVLQADAPLRAKAASGVGFNPAGLVNILDALQ